MSRKPSRKMSRRGSRNKGPTQFRIKASNRSELQRWVKAIRAAMGGTNRINTKAKPLEGWLFRKPKSIFKSWQKRWFLLARGPTGCMLSYYLTSTKVQLRDKWAVSGLQMGPRSQYAIVMVENNGELSYKVQ